MLRSHVDVFLVKKVIAAVVSVRQRQNPVKTAN